MLVSECLDVGGLLWCQDTASLLLWQSSLELRLQLWTLDGRKEHQLVISDTAPVTSVCLSACGRMAAVHSADGTVNKNCLLLLLLLYFYKCNFLLALQLSGYIPSTHSELLILVVHVFSIDFTSKNTFISQPTVFFHNFN